MYGPPNVPSVILHQMYTEICVENESYLFHLDSARLMSGSISVHFSVLNIVSLLNEKTKNDLIILNDPVSESHAYRLEQSANEMDNNCGG
jgi:hypothetical protein